MKLFFSIILIIGLVACSNSNEQNGNADLDQDGAILPGNEVDINSVDSLYFSGAIGEYPVIMAVSNEEGATGRYRYMSSSAFMNLKGDLKNAKELDLSEFNAKGVVTGTFEGMIDANGSYSGFWTNQLKDKPKLHFELAAIDMREFITLDVSGQSTKINNSTSEASYNGEQFSGEYKYWIGGEDAPTGAIRWVFIFIGGDFNFNGRYEEECGLVEISGTGKLTSSRSGIGSIKPNKNSNDAPCKFEFNFDEEFVYVIENGCFGYSEECPLFSLSGKIPRSY